MFREADCVLITKIDLLPYLTVDVGRIETHIHWQVNPRATVICVSASSGLGLPTWHAWIRQQLSLRLSMALPVPANR